MRTSPVRAPVVPSLPAAARLLPLTLLLTGLAGASPTASSLQASPVGGPVGLAGSAAATAPEARPAPPHPFGFEDLVRLHRVSDAQLAPDGGRVVYVRAVPDVDKNQMSSALFVVPLSPAGQPARQLTFPVGAGRGLSRDHSPRFSPDGQSLAFISNRDGTEQLYLLDLRGGEAQRLTTLPAGAAGPVWTPDGQAVVVESAVFPECPALPGGEACNRKRAEEADSGPIKARVIERLFYRHWDSWFDGRRAHLIRVPVRAPTRLADLTQGDLDSPGIARVGDAPYVFSPDGKELAVVQNRDRELSTSTNNDIFLYGLSTGRVTNLTEKNPATDTTPRYSKNGRMLAYLAQRRPGFEADRWVLWVYDRQTGARRALTESLDATVDDIAWAPDGARIFFTTSLLGRGRIYRVGLDGTPPVEVAVADAHHVQVTPDGQGLIYIGSSLGRAAEVYRVALQKDGSAAGPPQAVTAVNDAAFASLQLGKVSELWAPTQDGRRVHSFLITPPGFDPAKKYPAAVIIHGGPQGVWGDGWHWRWNGQVYAGAGYVTLLVNPRGSEGFGQRFVDEVSGDWGGKPYDDIMRAVDALVALPYVDGRRVTALGASYGGYMVNWIAGHSDRFVALVSHDGVFDLRSMAGETEELWFPRWEFGGDPWASDQYDRFSPSRFVQKMKTPMLVITNERDYRVPVGQGMQLFTALQLRKVPSKMVIFPDENHWVVKPGNSRLWHASVLDFLHRYAGGAKVDPKLLSLSAVRAK